MFLERYKLLVGKDRESESWIELTRVVQSWIQMDTAGCKHCVGAVRLVDRLEKQPAQEEAVIIRRLGGRCSRREVGCRAAGGVVCNRMVRHCEKDLKLQYSWDSHSRDQYLTERLQGKPFTGFSILDKRQERIYAERINVGDLSLNVQPDSCPR